MAGKPTTARELIAQLSALPPDTPIFVRGYEGGFDDACVGECVHLRRNVNPQAYYGAHEHADGERPADCVGYVIEGKA